MQKIAIIVLVILGCLDLHALDSKSESFNGNNFVGHYLSMPGADANCLGDIDISYDPEISLIKVQDSKNGGFIEISKINKGARKMSRWTMERGRTLVSKGSATKVTLLDTWSYSAGGLRTEQSFELSSDRRILTYKYLYHSSNQDLQSVCRWQRQ